MNLDNKDNIINANYLSKIPFSYYQSFLSINSAIVKQQIVTIENNN